MEYFFKGCHVHQKLTWLLLQKNNVIIIKNDCNKVFFLSCKSGLGAKVWYVVLYLIEMFSPRLVSSSLFGESRPGDSFRLEPRPFSSELKSGCH